MRIMPNFEEGIRLYAAMEIPVSICYFTYKLLPVWLKVLISKEVLTECGAIRAPKIFARMGSIIQKGLSPTMLIRLLISEFDTFNVDMPLNVHAAMFALFLGSWK